jgi:hypothetical protein
MDNFDLKKYLTEGVLRKNLSDNFEVGDKVKVNAREGFEELIGLEGTVVGKNPKKGALYIDFGKKIIGDGFTTYDLGGLVQSDTGLGFYDRGWISSKIDPKFDIRNLDKLT